VSVRRCVLLWARPGREAALAAYEDQVLARLGEHGGRVLARLRGDGAGAAPLEVQVIEFDSQAQLDAYLDDPRRTTLADQRDAAVARTEVFPVDLV
jgi:uncharacterized protein (DUF1330 family)